MNVTSKAITNRETPREPAHGSRSYVHVGLGWIGDRGGGLERYQDGVCRQHAAAGADVTALVQSRVEVVQSRVEVVQSRVEVVQSRVEVVQSRVEVDPSGVPYRITAFASPDERRRDKLKKLRHEIKPLLESCPTVVTHHASVSHSLLPSLRDLPHVVHFHGPWAQEAQIEGSPKWKTFVQRQQEAQVYRSADRIITLSEAFKEIVVRDYGADEGRVRVIPGAIDTAEWSPAISRQAAREQLGWPTDRPILITMRRLVHRVGVDVLVDAVAKIVDRHPDLLLLIGGTGPLADPLDETIADRGLSANVRRLGYVDAADLSTAYRAADFSVVPTQYLEGFGLVTLESLAAGTPALVTPVGSLPDVVGDLSTSLVFPDCDADSIAEGLDAVLQGTASVPDELECRRFVRDRYDWSVVAPRVLDAYREASGGESATDRPSTEQPSLVGAR